MEGLSVLVWGNLPLGNTISCPTLEKVLTSGTYTDRVLGSSDSLTVAHGRAAHKKLDGNCPGTLLGAQN